MSDITIDLQESLPHDCKEEQGDQCAICNAAIGVNAEMRQVRARGHPNPQFNGLFHALDDYEVLLNGRVWKAYGERLRASNAPDWFPPELRPYTEELVLLIENEVKRYGH